MNIDGMNFPPNFEEKLNSAFKTAFADKSGEVVLDYLRQLTLDSACMPGASTNEVLMREGARWVVGIILERVHRGKNPDVRNHDREHYSRRVERYFGSSLRDRKPSGVAT